MSGEKRKLIFDYNLSSISASVKASVIEKIVDFRVRSIYEKVQNGGKGGDACGKN